VPVPEELLQFPPVCGEALIKTKRAGAWSEELLQLPPVYGVALIKKNQEGWCLVLRSSFNFHLCVEKH